MRPTTDIHAPARLTALFRAGLLALAIVAILPLPAAAAADPDRSPASVAPADEEPTPSPDPTPEPTPTPDPTPSPTPVPTPGIRSVLNFQSDTVVRQYGRAWCVPAVTQTMWNLIHGTSNTSYARQRALYSGIRAHNRYRYGTLGNDFQGWAWALRRYTGEDYQVRTYASKDRAIAGIVAAIDRTGHPVGITINHGRHAWIVLGYKSQADAADPAKRKILGFYVSGPLGARSTDPWKYRYLTMSAFRKKYGYYHEWQRKVVWEGKYVFVSD
jgi:hypothetical protein